MVLLPAVLLGLDVAPGAAQTSGQAALWGTQGAGCTAPAGVDKPWLDRQQSAECRARFVLAQFRSLDEKLRYLSPPPPATEGAPPPVRDVMTGLGLTAIQASDGPAGLVRGGTATALPSPLSVAASFDPSVARRYGDILGEEFRAAGLGGILGPAFDIARSWKFGRLSESMGEDPFLVAQMAGAEVKAIQSHGVIVTMKHFAVYGQEAGRVGDSPSGLHSSGNNLVSEKALREIFLPGFEAAVKVGGAAGVMCSFPRVNGVYACENSHLFDILKREWRFDGVVTPDFPTGQRSITRAIMAGLDAGGFGKTPTNAALNDEKPLRQAVADGEVPEARIDDLILRRLIPAFRLGIFDTPPAKLRDEVSTQANRDAAADLLIQGSVLLRNEKGLLPFDAKLRSIAVIGVQASDKAHVVEQGSPYVKPTHLVPALDAVRARAGRSVRVLYAPGTSGLDPLPLPATGLFVTPDGQPGFRADYVANANLDFSGPALATQKVDRVVLDKQPQVAALPAGNQWSVRYSARLTPKQSGIHKFSLHGSGSARLVIDGVERGHFDRADFGSAAFANVALTKGQTVDVRIDYTPRAALGPERRQLFGMNMGLTLEFGYAPPDSLIDDAVQAARAADVAVVFVGERVGEGMDRASLALQNDQDALIEAVARANPRTLVILNTGGPVAMPWLSRVAAVMEMWLPGDAAGPATARMLFGDAEPGGRLPVTFAADETQGPATKPYQFPGTIDPATGQLDTAYFDEGVFVGYRYWDQHGQAPLFPFGHGLGYGDIAFAAPELAQTADGGVSLKVSLTNRGRRAGSEVAQLYVGLPQGTGEPPRQLKGFARVVLKPGETQQIAIDVPRGALRYWDEDQARWRIAAGRYQLFLGRSSRDIVWRGSVDVAGD